MAIYSQALSGSTIANHYTYGVKGLGYCNFPSTGPIAQWKFDEGSGTDAQDSAGSNDGTISGATWTTDSVSGTSLHFDGTGQVILPSSSTFIPFANSSITISAWFKADTISSGENRYRIFNLAYGSGPGSGLIIGVGSNNNIQFYNYNDDDTTAWATAITTGTWYHAVLTYDGTAFRMYLNGQPDGNPAIKSLDAGGSFGARIGSFNGSDYGFKGTIDEVAVWNRNLSDQEISDLYSAQQSGQ